MRTFNVRIHHLSKTSKVSFKALESVWTVCKLSNHCYACKLQGETETYPNIKTATVISICCALTTCRSTIKQRSPCRGHFVPCLNSWTDPGGDLLVKNIIMVVQHCLGKFYSIPVSKKKENSFVPMLLFHHRWCVYSLLYDVPREVYDINKIASVYQTLYTRDGEPATSVNVWHSLYHNFRYPS